MVFLHVKSIAVHEGQNLSRVLPLVSKHIFTVAGSAVRR
jgi:hypothetical protein